MAQGYADGPRRSAAEIEQDIGRTRAEIGLTLDALRYKLTARHLLERGMDMITESIGDGQGISIGFDRFRASPIALAMIGVGAVWLVAANTGVLDTVAQDERVQSARRRLTDLTGLGGSGAPRGQGPTFVSNPALGADERSRTGGWVHQAADAARGAMRAVRDTAGDYAGSAGEQASNVGGRMSGALQRHPLLIGMAGLFAGAIVASLLPRSRVEDEWVGQSRDQAMKRAGEISREMVRRVRNSIDHSIDRATSEPVSGEAAAF